MLGQRIITGLILFLAVSALIFVGSGTVFAIFLLLMLILAGAEWSRLAGWQRPYPAVLLFVLVVVGAYFVPLSPAFWAALGILWWLAFALAMQIMPVAPNPAPAFWRRVGIALAGIPSLVPALYLALLLQAGHPALLLWIIMIVSAGDVGAYLMGKRYGRHRLAPRISPGKTWEGLAGGLLGSAVMGTLGAFMVMGGGWERLIIGASLGLLAGLFAVLGDLGESFLKRRAGVKDSGHLLPGHGGLLDRLDSLSAGIPAFVGGLYFLGWMK
ncbi:MAG: phosphatidate cytidylyltransferase [Acidithiobacillus sp.]